MQSEGKQPALGIGKTHDRRATERSLLDAASRLFGQKGYENATTREIAAEAKCAEALIQRYFGGKNGLLLAIVHEGKRSVAMIDVAQLPLQDMLIDEIRQLFDAAAFNQEARSQHIKITFSRAMIDPDFADFKNIVMRPERLAIVETRLRKYQEVGKIGDSIDLAAATEMLLGGIFQLAFVHRHVMNIPASEYSAKAAGFCTIFSRGIAP